MKCNKILKLIFCFTLLLAPLAKAAPLADAEAKQWVNTNANKLLDAFAEEDLAKKYATLDELFLNHVDLDYISKFVAGKYWKQMNAEQQNKFQALFKRYALASYKNFPLTFKNRISYQIVGVSSNKQNTDVAININLKEVTNGGFENIIVTFKLDKKNDKVKVIDIKVTESSLILSYRNQFYKMIQDSDEDIGWFLEDFETSVISTEKTNQMRLEEREENEDISA